MWAKRNFLGKSYLLNQVPPFPAYMETSKVNWYVCVVLVICTQEARCKLWISFDGFMYECICELICQASVCNVRFLSSSNNILCNQVKNSYNENIHMSFRWWFWNESFAKLKPSPHFMQFGVLYPNKIFSHATTSYKCSLYPLWPQIPLWTFSTTTLFVPYHVHFLLDSPFWFLLPVCSSSNYHELHITSVKGSLLFSSTGT